jgi:hypothetical protein
VEEEGKKKEGRRVKNLLLLFVCRVCSPLLPFFLFFFGVCVPYIFEKSFFWKGK